MWQIPWARSDRRQGDMRSSWREMRWQFWVAPYSKCLGFRQWCLPWPGEGEWEEQRNKGDTIAYKGSWPWRLYNNAIACQHEIVDVIIDAKADYLISVKKNQKKLCKTIEDYFSEIDIYGNKLNGKGHIPETRYRYSISEESSHGRLEKRVCQVYNNGVLSKVLKWNGVNSVVCLTNTKKYIKSGKTTIEKHYYITSLPLDSDRIIETIRSHWSIENNLHWQLDVSFNEDAQKKKKNAARNFSVLNKITMTQLKNNKRKASLKGKRKMAGWSDEFLAELLDAPWHNEEIK